MPQSVHPQSTAELTPAASPRADSALAEAAFVSQDVSSEILVVTHTETGKILSIHWPQSTDCQSCEALAGQSIDALFGPVAAKPYMAHVQKVLSTGHAEEFKCVVRCGNQPVSFELLLSPLPLKQTLDTLIDGDEAPESIDSDPQQTLNQQTSDPQTLAPQNSGAESLGTRGLVGVGRRISPEVTQLAAVRLASSKDTKAQKYYEMLSNVASNIRRTLDITTIWQQTVNGLGNMLELDRCLVCDYSKAMQTLKVVAEYHQSGLHPCIGKTFELPQKPDFQQTLQSLKPVISDFERGNERGEEEQFYTVLTVATCYQDEPNSILVLQQPPHSPWNPLEIELVQELTDQVGTAIAHAKLYQASQNISDELRVKSYELHQKNDQLRRKHDELEEAKQQAEEASRLKSDFLANTSHELRTPLNGMIGFLRLVLDDMADDEEEKTEFIQESHKSALHLLNLINDVLDIAKIEAGKMDLDMSAVSLNELLKETEQSQRPHVERRGLSFDIDLPATLDEIKLYGNYQRLKQVLLNLVGNANKFTHEGGITIGVEIKPQPVEFGDQTWPGLVKISVADTGIGVSLEKQDRLFQTFSQVDSARTRQYEGTGLGLAISQRLIEAMGGKVQFISMGEGLGSTVTFTALLYQEPVMTVSPESDG
ncbi:MAG: ATP-binding protein [Cyanobacteria bacterium P01_D01_bin.105]